MRTFPLKLRVRLIAAHIPCLCSPCDGIFIVSPFFQQLFSLFYSCSFRANFIRSSIICSAFHPWSPHFLPLLAYLRSVRSEIQLLFIFSLPTRKSTAIWKYFRFDFALSPGVEQCRNQIIPTNTALLSIIYLALAWLFSLPKAKCLFL